MRFPIAKRYRELVLAPFRPRKVFTALKSVDLEVDEGDRIAVLGPNGAGKTTFLKLVGGLLLPSEGEILVNSHNTLHHNAAARKSVGFVMNEERSFFWRLTGRQNLEFFARLYDLDPTGVVAAALALKSSPRPGTKPVSTTPELVTTTGKEGHAVYCGRTIYKRNSYWY